MHPDQQPMPSSYVPNSYPAPLPRTPGAVTLARVCAGVQATMIMGFIALAGLFALVALSSGPRADTGDTFGGFLAFVALIGAVVLVVPLLLIGIPLLLLRPGRDGARIALIVGESICTAFGIALTCTQGAVGAATALAGPIGIGLVLGIVTIIALCQPAAVQWSIPTQR